MGQEGNFNGTGNESLPPCCFRPGSLPLPPPPPLQPSQAGAMKFDVDILTMKSEETFRLQQSCAVQRSRSEHFLPKIMHCPRWSIHCYHCLPWRTRQELRFCVTTCWAIARFQDDLHSSPPSSRCAGMTLKRTAAKQQDVVAHPLSLEMHMGVKRVEMLPDARCVKLTVKPGTFCIFFLVAGIQPEVGRKIGVEGHQLVRELERSLERSFPAAEVSRKNLSRDVSRDTTNFQESASVSIPSWGW